MAMVKIDRLTTHNWLVDLFYVYSFVFI